MGGGEIHRAGVTQDGAYPERGASEAVRGPQLFRKRKVEVGWGGVSHGPSVVGQALHQGGSLISGYLQSTCYMRGILAANRNSVPALLEPMSYLRRTR